MKEFLEQYSLVIGLVVFGATAHALAQFSVARHDDEVKFDGLDFLVAAVIAAFSGTLFGIVASFLWEDALVVHAVAGTGAFLGLKGLNSLAEAVIELLLSKKGSSK